MTASIVGVTTASGTGTGRSIKWPAGTAPGDLAVLMTGYRRPSGWTHDTVDWKVLTSTDVGPPTLDWTESSGLAWYLILAVLRSVSSSFSATTLASVFGGSSNSYTAYSLSNHGAPMALLYLIGTTLQPGDHVTPPAADTDYIPGGLLTGSQATAFGSSFPSGYDQRSTVAGRVQTSTGDEPSRVFTTASHPTTWGGTGFTWNQATPVTTNGIAMHVGGPTVYAYGVRGAGSGGGSVSAAIHGGGTVTVRASGGKVPQPAVAITTGLTVTAIAPVTSYPAPAPGTPTLDGPYTGEAVIYRVSDVWDAPTLVNGVPQNWVMS